MSEELYGWLCSFYQQQYTTTQRTFREVPRAVWVAVSDLAEMLKLINT